MTDAEVLVVGGGPAGAATAARLARAGRDVLVLDRAVFPREKACADFLSPGAVRALDALGVLRDAAPRGAWQRGMRIVSEGASFTLRYRDGERGLGIPRRALDALLLARARAEGATTRERAGVAGALIDRGRVAGVRLRSGETLRGRFVVAADGLRSPVARSLGLERASRWPRRLGLVARFGNVSPAPYGLMAVGREGYCGVASVGGGETSVGMALLPSARQPGEPVGVLFERMLAALPAAREAVSGAERTTAIRGLAPLVRRVRNVAGPGYLLVGDAAGFTDPFTGEGVFRALRGAEIAADAVLKALRRSDAMPLDYWGARRRAFAAKDVACVGIQAALAIPPLFDYCLRRAERRAGAGRLLAGVFGDYIPARAALRPSFLANLMRP
ncbi:MAG: NAD(P)/FAD-dependent oxidoreductase [Actinomycetota bacterium]|nr:NAD(P)/FAD-dependent oxidoreductase [Actinomycetota bacterium]